MRATHELLRIAREELALVPGEGRAAVADDRARHLAIAPGTAAGRPSSRRRSRVAPVGAKRARARRDRRGSGDRRDALLGIVDDDESGRPSSVARRSTRAVARRTRCHGRARRPSRPCGGAPGSCRGAVPGPRRGARRACPLPRADQPSSRARRAGCRGPPFTSAGRPPRTTKSPRSSWRRRLRPMPGGPWITMTPPWRDSDRLRSDVTIGFRSTNRDVRTAARSSIGTICSPSAFVSCATTSCAERGRSAGAVERR
jgi:hypothetical protein